jgi:hypothetical protein
MASTQKDSRVLSIRNGARAAVKWCGSPEFKKIELFDLIKKVDELLHLFPECSDADANVGILAPAPHPVRPTRLGCSAPNKIRKNSGFCCGCLPVVFIAKLAFSAWKQNELTAGIRICERRKSSDLTMA